MARRFGFFIGIVVIAFPAVLSAADQNDLKAILGRKILAPRQTQTEVEKYVAARLPAMPKVQTANQWNEHAARLRAQVLERVVYRGAAAAWRDARTRVEWLDTIKGGPGYRIKKLRYEALPGLWIPALLYEPEKLQGKVPVILNVNGHDGNGKAAGYKQIRCINQAKRGMLALNVEWLGMGQLRTTNFHHGRMNQLDLCGTSGLAPFYLSMKRGLDVLLRLEHADPKRVAVTGLSGGGWQTIIISSLDTRVTLTNPVAGYSGFLTRIQHYKDLGDSEQTPCDLATVADYTHLTAMMAPRPTLLTYNSKDDCCFEAGYVLPALRAAAEPIFKLYGKLNFLRSHVNDNPGTHNYEKDNRQAFYRMLGDHFYASSKEFDAKEIPSEKEVKSKAELMVDLPAKNEDFHTLALALARKLPRDGQLPREKEAARKWQEDRRRKLHTMVRAVNYQVQAVKTNTENRGGIQVTHWQLRLDNTWTVPVVELVQGAPKRTAILINDAGRHTDPVNVERLLKAGNRVLAVDLFYLGESRIVQHDWLFALMVATVGQRSLGLQASQLAAVARWSAAEHRSGPVTVAAVGPRTGTAALVAAGLEPKAISSLELDGALGSVKEVIEQNRSVDQMPEMFCFGLLEWFDVKQLTALVAPRPVRFLNPSKRASAEMGSLKEWYRTLGVEFDPVRLRV
jgi:dienelactone hydrolase